MLEIKKLKKHAIFMAILILVISIANCAFAVTQSEINSIQTKRNNAQKKIKELKLKETKEINKLYKSQGSLEVTKKELEITTQNLEKTKKKLEDLQSSLDTAAVKFHRDQTAAGKRLREIYKGERIGFLNILFMTDDISGMLDKIYYQEIITKNDAEQLKKLQDQIAELTAYTREIEEQKQNVLYSMARIQNKKDKIAQDIYTSQTLIKKLQTDRKTYEKAEKELAKQSDQLTKMLRSNAKNTKEVDQFTTTSDFIMPVRAAVTSPFGWRTHPIFKSRKFHSGVDLGAGYGTPVKCSNSGVVTFSGWYGGYGKVVIVDHGLYKGKPTSTLYAHLSSYSVSKGAKVSKGQVIARVGSTGYSTGPHLHFEVRVNGSPTNPFNYAK